MMKNLSYVLYLDLLATTASAQEAVDVPSYAGQLECFRSCIADLAYEVLHPDLGDKVYAFSDCAFLGSNDLHRVLRFAQSMRQRLMVDGIFFKAAVDVGNLAATDFGSPLSADYSPKKKRQINRTVSGHFFAEDCIAVAESEKQMKGIGVLVSPRIGDKSGNDQQVKDALANYTKKNCFFRSENTPVPTLFSDVALDPNTANEGFDIILKRYLLETTRSKKVGRYYLPILLLCTKCTDYRAYLSGKEPRPPRSYVRLVEDPRLATELLKNLGVSFVYYALLEKMHRDFLSLANTQRRGAMEKVDDLIHFFAGRSVLRKAAGSIPAEICPNQLQQRVTQRHVVRLVPGSE